MTKKEMMEALDGLDDDATIRVEVEQWVYYENHTIGVKNLKLQNVFTQEQCVLLHGEL